MKYISLVVVVFFSLGTFPLSACAGDEGPTILTPPDHAIVQGRFIDLVFNIGPNSPDALRIAVNGELHRPIPTLKDRKTVCVAGLPLTQGKNEITVSLLKAGKTIGQTSTSVYLGADPTGTFDAPPTGFTRYLFHSPIHDNACRMCHNLDFSKAPENPSSPKQSPCYLCHAQLTGGKFVHGPASVWACIMCHNLTHGTDQSKPDQSYCVPCHGDSIDAWKTEKHQHGPVAMGFCTTCHDPHSSNHPFFLRKETTDLCSTCHEDTASRPHVVSMFFTAKGHPVYRPENPFQPGKSFNCASCHRPHGSSFDHLLRWDGSSMKSFCTSCHKILPQARR